ncbi:MAG: aldo/keto reductase [Alphaproteobacteria bacterium]|nr:MAG: aldo/keto reductase [Alphaproteobacteria bacterium]
MHKRPLGPFSAVPIGLGAMNLSHAYGDPVGPDQAARVIATALELGVDHFDTAALYGFGANEKLVGPLLKPHRSKILLASKCGMTGVDGKRVIDGRPETLVRTCDQSLARLGTDVIDLYYLHRWDKTVPIEDSVGALSRLVEAGKIRAIGLSEVSASTLRKAQAVHPVAAVQSEYSLWSRNVEIALLDACADLGVAFVAFSPVARGFLVNLALDPASFTAKDIRRSMPRFAEPHFSNNRPLAEAVANMAADLGVASATLVLAWLLARRPFIHAIPGTTDIGHLHENVAAATLNLGKDVQDALDRLFAPRAVSGPRYPAAIQTEIDTEEFPGKI